jgi:hypothetical protein
MALVLAANVGVWACQAPGVGVDNPVVPCAPTQPNIAFALFTTSRQLRVLTSQHIQSQSRPLPLLAAVANETQMGKLFSVSHPLPVQPLQPAEVFVKHAAIESIRPPQRPSAHDQDGLR